ncbi:2-phospho-L-lactate guanylyltransferase [Plantactinospora sp. B6F1]|uniref:2-phospho-L-lactate guanylyltransferase n=1 Tax=Plantactinospora sp. B6F1 TaxID=3158971 RepID=UPI0032D94BFE
MAERNWTVVVPVKRLGSAKSRLRGALDGVPHELLALALAEDTAEAVLGCPAVRELLVVTNDPEATRALGRLGARIVAEPPAAGLNPAFTRGAAAASGGPVAALTADLPALRPAELAEALRAAAGPPDVRRFVADAPGTGTVLLTAAPGADLDPRFGPGSAAAHTASGARPLTGAWPTLRRDVDTPADLRAAVALGLGRHTAAVTRRSAPACRARGHGDPTVGAGLPSTRPR